MDLWNISEFGLSSYEQKRVEFAFINDCPELMICSPVIRVGNFYAKLGSSDWFKEYKESVLNELTSCLWELDKLRSSDLWGYSDFNKEKAFDRNIAQKPQYLLDNDGPEGSLHLESGVRSALSAIVNRTAVCEGYSRSTQLALRYFGIPCIYVRGNIPGRGNHAWNIVCIDGNWCHYDATWNQNDNYMNLKDSEIFAERSLVSDYSEHGFILPDCR